MVWQSLESKHEWTRKNCQTSSTNNRSNNMYVFMYVMESCVDRTSSMPSLSSIWYWIRVRVFALELCLWPVMYYHSRRLRKDLKCFILIFWKLGSGYGTPSISISKDTRIQGLAYIKILVSQVLFGYNLSSSGNSTELWIKWTIAKARNATFH